MEPHLFDGIFKRLFTLSNRLQVTLVNGLFDEDFPPDQTVDLMTPDQDGPGLSRQYADVVVRLGADWFHVEAQVTPDRDMPVRMFRYGLEIARRNLGRGDDGSLSLAFPKSRVVHVDRPARAPGGLGVAFPGRDPQAFPVPSLAVQDLSPEELGALGLDALMPFVPLRLRRRALRAGPEGRTALVEELRDLVGRMDRALEAGQRAGRLWPQDRHRLIDLADTLIRHEFTDKYDEFKEADIMSTMFKTRVEEAQEQTWALAEARFKQEADIMSTMFKTRVEEAQEQAWALAEARFKEAEERAIQQGLEQGRASGRTEERRQIALNALARGLDPDEVAGLTGLSLDEVHGLRGPAAP